MTDPDQKLVRKAVRGDRRALEHLYDRYRSRLLGYLVRNLGNAALAEDVFQETWIKVLGGIDRYRPGSGTFQAWLFRIAGNAAIDRTRRETVRRAESLDAPADGTGASRGERLPSQAAGPERSGEARLMLRDLDAALQTLPERQRSAVLLRHQQGLSYAELARALRVPEGTAKTLVHRAVRTLRGSMEGWLDDDA